MAFEFLSAHSLVMAFMITARSSGNLNSTSSLLAERSREEARAEVQMGPEQPSFSLSFIEHTGFSFNRIQGNEQAETIYGTAGSDLIQGLAGDDRIRGLAGDNFITSNQGADLINGNQGNDVIRRGGKDNDQVFGGQGDDWVYEDLGDDQVFGNLGNDHLYGDEGNDFLDGGEGNDTYYFIIGDGQDQIQDTGGGVDSVHCAGFNERATRRNSGGRLTLRYSSGETIIIENASSIERVACP